MSASVTIEINGERRGIQVGTSLRTLMHEGQIRGDLFGVAVAVNNAVVPRDKWDDLELMDGDKILVIQATQGG
ncbi:MAG: sulfur carrier protein ThiS [Bdellovibrionales bacterium]|nr:sulfur carrier protein ThiS [Bdellovibrionales bacterium]